MPLEEGNLTIRIPLTQQERSRLDSVCGPGQRVKRGQWVREAIVEKLDREVPLRAGEERAG